MSGLYAADGSWNVTVVDGTTQVGFYASDGSMNVIQSDGTPGPLIDVCGATRVTLVLADTTHRYADDGSLNVTQDPYIEGGPLKVTPVSGSFGAMIQLSGSHQVDEDIALNGDVGTLSVINGSGSYTFTITSDPDSKFALNVDGVTLEVDAVLDYETDTDHQVTIEADNGVDDPISRTFTINVGNVFELPIPGAPTLDWTSASDDDTPNFDIGLVTGLGSPDDTEVGDILTIEYTDTEGVWDTPTNYVTHEVTSGDLVDVTLDLAASSIADGTYWFRAYLTRDGADSDFTAEVEVTLGVVDTPRVLTKTDEYRVTGFGGGGSKSGASIGTADATRRVVVMVCSTGFGGASVTGVTIDGNAMTQVVNKHRIGVSSSAANVAIYEIAWPTGTTADIVTGINTAEQVTSTYIYSLTGGDGSAAIDSDSGDDGTDAWSGGSLVASRGLTGVDLGCVLGGSSNNSNVGGVDTYVSLTEDVDFASGGDFCSDGCAHENGITSGAVTVGFTLRNSLADRAAAFAFAAWT